MVAALSPEATSQFPFFFLMEQIPVTVRMEFPVKNWMQDVLSYPCPKKRTKAHSSYLELRAKTELLHVLSNQVSAAGSPAEHHDHGAKSKRDFYSSLLQMCPFIKACVNWKGTFQLGFSVTVVNSERKYLPQKYLHGRAQKWKKQLRGKTSKRGVRHGD